MAEETKATETTETTDYKALYEELQGKHDKLKANFDKTSSEVADYKRKEKERMSDDERKQVEQEEREKHYAELEKQIALRNYADELGYVVDEKQKEKIVKAFVDGDIKGALKELKNWEKAYKTELEKTIKAELMKQNPQATPQSSNATSKTKDEIMAIKDPMLRQAEIAKNINLFT